MYRRTSRLASQALAACLFITGLASAQEGSFADDFSVDSTRYTSGSFDNSSGNFSVEYTNNALQMTATGTSSAPGSAFLVVQDTSDSFSADVQLDPASDVESTVFVDAIMYSDTETPAPDTSEGDVQVQLTASVFGDGSAGANYCFSRRTADGNNVNLSDFGGEFCTGLPGAVINVGQTHTLGLAIDRVARTLTLSVDSASTVITLPSEVYPASSNLRRIQSWFCCELEGTSVVQVSGVSTQNFTDDFTSAVPIFDRYQELPSGNGRTASHADSRLRLLAMSEGGGNGLSLSPAVRTDYIEAVVTLSSESTIAEDRQRAEARIDTIFYNDTADGTGNENDRTGDVRAEIVLITEADGRRLAEYCLSRSNDAEFNDRTRLLDGNSCRSFPMVVEFDKPYRIAIELDRSIPAMIYRLDGFTETVPINTPIFQPARGRQEVGTDANRLGTAVVYIDDLRTAPQALTAGEMSNGMTAPAGFPPEPDLAALQVDSTLPTPFNFRYTDNTLDFVDNFSGASFQFGFWSGNANRGTRGQSGVQYSNGAIEMQTNSAIDNDDGNWTEFYLNDNNSDSLTARVSLSSSSRLPADPDAEAQISIRATFLNDTQDGGFDGREGDIESGITLRLRGDGRREINIDLRRRNADGSSEDLRPYDIVELEPVDDLTPTLDTVYEFGVRVDRERQVLIFSVDGTSVEYQLTSQAFRPAISRLLVSTNHRGSSGVAIANLHSVSTDNIAEDFSVAPPELAPYWPSFQGQQPGHAMLPIDGRLRLEADNSAQTSDRGPFLIAHGLSDHVSAIIELSSESNVVSDGEGFVRVGAQFYNDTSERGNGENNIGDVYSEIRIEDRGDGERFVSYCTERVNNADFSAGTELIGGDLDNCPRMATIPALDTAYPASITIDRVNATLTYRFGDETVVYDIATGIFVPHSAFPGIAVRASEGSKIIAFADDLSFAENPVPLESSASLLVSAADESNTNGGPIGSDSAGSGSGGGCSINGTSGDELPLFGLAATVLLLARRRRKIQ